MRLGLLFCLPTDEDAEKDKVGQNRKILDKLQQSLSEDSHTLLNANCRAVTQPTMCDEDDYSWEHRTEMLKILIAGTVCNITKGEKTLGHISNFLHQESPYAAVSIVIAHLPELQQEDPMALTVRKELASPNVNVYSGQLGEPWSEAEGVLHYDGKPYIPETLQTNLLERNHDDPLAGHFGVEKTLELLTRKYFWPKIRADVEKYVQGCDICMSCKAQKHKPYGSLQSLPVPTHKWKDLSMDFVIGLPMSKDWRGVEYDSILVIVDPLTKMIHYEPVLATLDAEQRAKVSIEAVIKYHGLPDSIVTNRGPLFISKFWPSLCYYLNVERRLSTAFHPQTDGHTKRQNSTMETYL